VAHESIGDAYINVHADTSSVGPEVKHDLDRIATESEAELDKSGRKIGDKVSDGLGETLRRRGKSFARNIEEGTRNTVVRVRSILRFDQIRDSFRRRFRRDVGDTISTEIGQALERSVSGGVLSKFGQGIADAIGSGFNVSGRSPLIGVLIPAILALVGVFTAAAQAVNALVAVLLIVPGLLAAIGLQVGVVMFAFHGLGEAVQGAFAAKNAKELDTALKGLTPSARTFVKELLPLRDFFKALRDVAQERFFSQLIGVVSAIRASLGPTLIRGFGLLAETAGRVFRDFGMVLASPVFKMFLNQLFPATERWLDALGTSLLGKRGFLNAILTMAMAVMPFMQRFGDLILLNLDRVAGLLFQLSSSPATQQWLDDMAATLQLVFDLLFNVGESIFFLLKQLNAAGGQNLITTLSEAFMQLSFFLASPDGKKALEGLVDLGIIGIKAFMGLVEAFLLVLEFGEVLGEFLNNQLLPTLGKIFGAIIQFAIDAATFLGTWIERIIHGIGNAVSSFTKKVSEIPGRIRRFFENFGALLVNSGRALIGGLIDGVRQKLGELWNILSSVAGRIGGFFGLSPAKEGPLSGRGYIKYRGQHLMQNLVEGIKSEVPALRETMTNATSNIVFGANSIQMQFSGPAPSPQQAKTTGSAMGLAAANAIAARNTQLVVRTI
jgi:phage-related protein